MHGYTTNVHDQKTAEFKYKKVLKKKKKVEKFNKCRSFAKV